MSYIRFYAVPDDAAFSPAKDEIGSQFVYIKKPNGVCPQVGVDAQFGIFHPYDKVVVMKIPPALHKKYKQS